MFKFCGILSLFYDVILRDYILRVDNVPSVLWVFTGRKGISTINFYIFHI